MLVSPICSFNYCSKTTPDTRHFMYRADTVVFILQNNLLLFISSGKFYNIYLCQLLKILKVIIIFESHQNNPCYSNTHYHTISQ